MYKKQQTKASMKCLTKGSPSQSKLYGVQVPKSLSKKQLPTFHTRSMIEYEEEHRSDTQGHHYSILDTSQKNKLSFVVALPQKPVERKSPVAKYVRKQPSQSTSSLNLRSTLKNIGRLDVPARESREGNNYEILLKLRQIIEEMRQKQTKNDQDIDRLKKINGKLQQQNRELIDTLKKYQNRDRQLSQKLRNLEGNRCIDHEIIIQSLKKVIDGQLHKIIELERQKITAESCSLRSSQAIENMDYFTHESTPSFPPSSPHPRLKQLLNRVTDEINSHSNDSRPVENKQNMQVQLDTFRKKPHLQLQQKYRTDDILMEIDNCLDSLSRRKRQLM